MFIKNQNDPDFQKTRFVLVGSIVFYRPLPNSLNFGPRNKRTCKANAAGENSSFIFTVCAKSVPLNHFKLAYVILQMAVKEFLKPTIENGDMGQVQGLWVILGVIKNSCIIC